MCNCFHLCVIFKMHNLLERHTNDNEEHRMRYFNHKCIFRKISYRPQKQWTNRPIYKFGSLRDFSCPSGRLQLQIWRSAGRTHSHLCRPAASALSSTWPRSWHPQPCEGETGRETVTYWYGGLQSEYYIYLFVCLLRVIPCSNKREE